MSSKQRDTEIDEESKRKLLCDSLVEMICDKKYEKFRLVYEACAGQKRQWELISKDFLLHKIIRKAVFSVASEKEVFTFFQGNCNLFEIPDKCLWDVKDVFGYTLTGLAERMQFVRHFMTEFIRREYFQPSLVELFNERREMSEPPEETKRVKLTRDKKEQILKAIGNLRYGGDELLLHVDVDELMELFQTDLGGLQRRMQLIRREKNLRLRKKYMVKLEFLIDCLISTLGPRIDEIHDCDHNTLAMWAAKTAHYDVLKKLCEAGADLEKINRLNQTIFDVAVDKKDWELFEILCQTGTNFRELLLGLNKERKAAYQSSGFKAQLEFWMQSVKKVVERELETFGSFFSRMAPVGQVLTFPLVTSSVISKQIEIRLEQDSIDGDGRDTKYAIAVFLMKNVKTSNKVEVSRNPVPLLKAPLHSDHDKINIDLEHLGGNRDRTNRKFFKITAGVKNTLSFQMKENDVIDSFVGLQLFSYSKYTPDRFYRQERIRPILKRQRTNRPRDRNRKTVTFADDVSHEKERSAEPARVRDENRHQSSRNKSDRGDQKNRSFGNERRRDGRHNEPEPKRRRF